MLKIPHLGAGGGGVKRKFQAMKVHVLNAKKKQTLTIQIAPSLPSIHILDVYGKSISFVKPVKQIIHGYMTKIIMKRCSL